MIRLHLATIDVMEIAQGAMGQREEWALSHKYILQQFASYVLEEAAKIAETHQGEAYLPTNQTGCGASWNEGMACGEPEKIAAAIRALKPEQI